MTRALSELEALLPPGGLLRGEAELASYSYDGALDRARPEAVVLAKDAQEVRRVISWCASRGVPFVARGAGTNLSGGCIPLRGGIVLSLARMNRILDVDTRRGVAVAEPGVINLRLQEELARVGFFYAPDPASYRVCTIGGNVAENAGGPRCLKYGVTTNHVLALEAVMPDGSLERFSAEDAGPDLLGLLVGAEGTLGVATRIWARILPAPESVRTLLAGFSSVEASVECVSGIIAAGVLPRALEAMDRVTVESVRDYSGADYPAAEAVLLIELDGPGARVLEESREVERLCRAHGCLEFRAAETPEARERLWEGRRGAYAAVARIAPNVLVEDGVVPRGLLPEAYRRVRAIAESRGVRVAMLFHAGDGNLHPNIAFDERDPEETRRVKEAGFEMLKVCVELGGSISGEHGIGMDKRAAMSWLFTPETLALFRRIKEAADPQGIANPDKVLPLPGEAPPGAPARPRRHALSPAAAELAEKAREAARAGRPLRVRGAGTRAPGGWGPAGLETLDTRGLRAVADLDRSNYTVTVEAGCPLRELKALLRERGLHAPLPEDGGSLGGLLASKAWPGVRDHVLGMRLLLPSGEVADLGGKVVKNVAGYDAARLLLGSWGTLAVILEVTLKLQPRPCGPPEPPPAPRPFVPGPWHRRIKRAFDPDNRFNPWVFGEA